MPYPEPARLIMIYEKTAEFRQMSVSYPNFLDWRRENHLFTDMAAYRGDDFNACGSIVAARGNCPPCLLHSRVASDQG